MRNQVKKMIALCFVFILSMLLIGCSKGEENSKKRKDLEFTVVEDADIPEKLQTAITDRKMMPFKLTYTTENHDFLYIIVGYGGQKSGGYSISVDKLYLTDNSIVIKTNLIGPGKDEPVTPNITYPYVVVKLEFIDKVVEFE